MRISQLFIYPVKSFAGIAVTRAALGPKGLSGDRQWMVVNNKGVFLSQRQVPKMALIRVKLTEQGLQLSAPGLPDLPVEAPSASAPSIEVKIWQDTCRANIASREVNQWINDYLQCSAGLKLVKFNSMTPRLPYQPQRFGENNAQFADAAPYLVANKASLASLNQHLQQSGHAQVSMARFRPNIVIEGLPAFKEQQLKYLDTGEFKFKMVDHCSRCAIITIDPVTGEKSPDNLPFKQLAALNPMPEQPKLPAFGVNACLAGDNSGENLELRVGQQLIGR